MSKSNATQDWQTKSSGLLTLNGSLFQSLPDTLLRVNGIKDKLSDNLHLRECIVHVHVFSQICILSIDGSVHILKLHLQHSRLDSFNLHFLCDPVAYLVFLTCLAQ